MNKHMAKFKQNTLIIKDTTIEHWMFIKGYNGAYSVSSFGRVRSNGRKEFMRGFLKPIQERILCTYKRKNSYVSVDLGKRNTQLVHRLVASVFRRNTENKPCVNHIDGNPSNNNVTNLEWCTYSENEQHSYKVLGKKPNISHLGLKGIECVHSKPVAVIDGEDKTILAICPTLNGLAKKMKFNARDLKMVCDGVKPNHKGVYFRWATRDEYKQITAIAV